MDSTKKTKQATTCDHFYSVEECKVDSKNGNITCQSRWFCADDHKLTKHTQTDLQRGIGTYVKKDGKVAWDQFPGCPDCA